MKQLRQITSPKFHEKNSRLSPAVTVNWHGIKRAYSGLYGTGFTWLNSQSRTTALLKFAIHDQCELGSTVPATYSV